MKIGVPKEIKVREGRVGITPKGVRELVRRGHEVIVQKGAGVAANITDSDFRAAGAEIAPSAQAVYRAADMIYKVKEPQPKERDLLKDGQLLFSFIHLDYRKDLTELLLRKRIDAVAFENIRTEDGGFPILRPMSDIAGRVSALTAARLLQTLYSGKGLLLNGMAGVAPAEVVVLGGGVAGSAAASACAALGAHVTLLTEDLGGKLYTPNLLPANVTQDTSQKRNVAKAVKKADVLINCIHWLPIKGRHLVTKEMVRTMKRGSLIVDVSCLTPHGPIETSKETTHDNPTYVWHGVTHYCVGNLPGIVPDTASRALEEASLPYAIKLAGMGFEKAVRSDKALAAGVVVTKGMATWKALEDLFGIRYTPLAQALAAASARSGGRKASARSGRSTR